MLNCVIPMVMHVVYDFGGYVEKNTGDGLLAIVGVEEEDQKPANIAIDIALVSLYLLTKLINPYLETIDITPVKAWITNDCGFHLLARVGVPKGSAKLDRSFLTAIGPTANIASKLLG